MYTGHEALVVFPREYHMVKEKAIQFSPIATIIYHLPKVKVLTAFLEVGDQCRSAVVVERPPVDPFCPEY